MRSSCSRGQQAWEESRESDNAFPIKNIYIRQVGIFWDVEDWGESECVIGSLDYPSDFVQWISLILLNECSVLIRTHAGVLWSVFWLWERLLCITTADTLIWCDHLTTEWPDLKPESVQSYNHWSVNSFHTDGHYILDLTMTWRYHTFETSTEKKQTKNSLFNLLLLN